MIHSSKAFAMVNIKKLNLRQIKAFLNFKSQGIEKFRFSPNGHAILKIYEMKNRILFFSNLKKFNIPYFEMIVMAERR